MPHETEQRRVTPGTELLTLRAENERLKAYLGRVLAMLEARIDETGATDPALPSGAHGRDVATAMDRDPLVIDDRDAHGTAHLSLRAGPAPMLVAAPEPEPNPALVLDERLSMVMRDLERIETHVESLLWRLGEGRTSLASGT